MPLDPHPVLLLVCSPSLPQGEASRELLGLQASPQYPVPSLLMRFKLVGPRLESRRRNKPGLGVIL